MGRRDRQGPAFMLWTLVCVAWSVAGLATDDVYLMMFVDDAYYYLVIADNLWRGLGYTFDGAHPTNGFHALWVWMLAPVVGLIERPDAAARVVFVAQVALVWGGAGVLWRALRAVRPQVASTWVVLLSGLAATPYAAKVLWNGTESAALFFAMCAATAGLMGGPNDQRPPLSMASGVVAVARWDALVFAAVQAACLLTDGRGRRGAAWAVGSVAVLVGIAAATNWLAVGHVLPVSGAIKLDGARYLSPRSVLVGCASLGVVLSVAAMWWRRDRLLARAWAPSALYAGFVATYAFGWRALRVPEIWTLAPVVLALSLLLASAIAGSRTRPLRRVLRVGAAAGIGGLALAWPYRLDPSTWRAQSEARDAGYWVSAHVPVEAWVAGWDVGAIAWHGERPIENLDGLVNSYAFFESVLRARGVHAYVHRDDGPDVIAQPLWLTERHDGYAGPDGTRLDDWHLIYVSCATIRTVSSRGRAGLYAHVVLARRGTEETLAAWLSRGAPECAMPAE